jgi:uncharacterized iron-regulated protein
MSFTTTLKAENKHQEIAHLLDFYNSELTFLETKLSEVVKRNTGHEALTEAEHFQNQFIVQRKTLEELTERLEKNKHFTYLQSADHAGKMDDRLLTDINAIVQETHTFEKIISDLRTQYKQFLLRWI